MNQPSRRRPGFPIRGLLAGRSVELNGEVNFALENGRVTESGAKDVTLGIRPEHFKLTEAKEGAMHLKVDHVEQLGADTLVHGRFGEENSFLTVRLSDIQHFEKNTVLSLKVPSEKLHLFDKQTGKKIGKYLEAISKIGFWFKIKAGPSFNPQSYSSISRT